MSAIEDVLSSISDVDERAYYAVIARRVRAAGVRERLDEFGFALLLHFMCGGEWTRTLGIVDAEARFGGVGLDCSIVSALFPGVVGDRLAWQERFITGRYEIAPEIVEFARRVLSGDTISFDEWWRGAR